MATIARRQTSRSDSLLSLFKRLSDLFGRRSVPQATSSPTTKPSVGADRDDLLQSKSRNTEMAMQTLKSSLKAGRITPEEYAARVAQLS